MILRVIATGSSGNCYVLEGERSALVIECGVPPERLFRFSPVPPSRITGCLVTHEHGDHARYIGRYIAMGMDVYASKGTLDAVGVTPSCHSHILKAVYLRQVGEFLVSPFAVRHDAAEPFGYFISHPESGPIIFVTDTRSVEYTFRKYGPAHIIVEVNYCDDVLDANVASGELDYQRARRVRDTHLSLEQACQLVKANETGDLQTVTMIHLSSGNSNAEDCLNRMRKTACFADIYMARPGLTVELYKSPFYIETK